LNLKQFEVRHAEEAMDGEEPVTGFYGYVAHMRVEGMSWSAEVDGTIVASAGLVPLWKGVAEAWMISSDDVGRHRIKVARQLRVMFDEVMWHRGLYRAQANIHHKFEKAIRLAEWLGFENEGLMRRFGIEGADYIRYAKVK
tara:strand:+ start:1525 stop:1947 length:423 start_codon:yes stop_codon:yes gene_type:complete